MQANEMNMRSKIVLGFCFFVVVAIAVAFIFPQIAATQYGYFDINNGRQKVERVSFGRVYRREIKDTEYSKLLTKLGFNEMPADWKLASRQSIGLRTLFPPGFVDYHEGTIEAQSRMFALTVEMKKLDESKVRELVEHFRILVQKGDSAEVRKYVDLVSKDR